MTSDAFMSVGPLRANPRMVATYLYLQEAPQQPVDAPDEWFLPQAGEQPPITVERTVQLLTGIGDLLDRLLLLRTYEPLNEETVQFEFYEAAKATFGEDKSEIREFFLHMYQLITQTPNGPRWGQFVMIFGLDEFIGLLQKRFDNPLG